MAAKFNVKNKSLLENTFLLFPEENYGFQEVYFTKGLNLLLPIYQTGCCQILIVDKNYKFMGLPAVPHSPKKLLYYLVNSLQHGIHFDLQNKFDH